MGFKGMDGTVFLGNVNASNFTSSPTTNIGVGTDTTSLSKNWRLLIGGNFGVRSDGTLYANGAKVNGIVNAEQGIFNEITVTLNSTGDEANIGMWHIGNPL
jgi:hypothetical protein